MSGISFFARQEHSMSSTTDKVNGTINNAVGTVKEAAGTVIGNDALKSEGQQQQLKGDAQNAVASLKDAVTHTVEKAAEVIGEVGHSIEHKAVETMKEVIHKADALIEKASDKVKHIGT
jgi:uncharacterized protein YjbJ (UPF0337 family)